MNKETILVIDFGGQYKELIARSVRTNGVYSQIVSSDISLDEIKLINPKGIILTGGPKSVYDDNTIKCDKKIFEIGIPVLGICYGMQLMSYCLGGKVKKGAVGEYGIVNVIPTDNKKLPNPTLISLGKEWGRPFRALMSHKDIVTQCPPGFSITAFSENNIAAIENNQKKLYGVQFHPETSHTEFGNEIMRHFLYVICGAKGDYHLDDYIDREIENIKKAVGKNRVLLGLSGGVDSSVCASLLSRAIPNQLTCVFVDHGFMRLGEGHEIERIFSKKKMNFIRVNTKERFLCKLKGIIDPEQKRKVIGEEFIRVFEEEALKLGDIPFLAQGTIYPDIVESGDSAGAVIKSHHNVGCLPKNMKFSKLIEPLSGLFKDEVRIVGRKLGLPKSLVERQPFPGPGLAIRIIGEITNEKLDVLSKVDAIVREEIGRLKTKPNQYFAVLTNTPSVGVKGDARTYDPVVAIRAVITSDFMTCEYATLSHKVLGKISNRITSEVSSISRVVYDITGKPPATIEWE
ncbi:MAG: glutamine-hydrolyzing GMP synthase [Candidatus Cloacimonetes bacterium]|nr:glutamine-hydrolyzing GMP synthase [Candidatus Cloacimonadota bacterium]